MTGFENLSRDEIFCKLKNEYLQENDVEYLPTSVTEHFQRLAQEFDRENKKIR